MKTIQMDRKRHQTISHFVARDFSPPECGIALGLCAMLGTTMPETAVNEDGEPLFGENKIRFAEDFLMPPPTCNFVRPKKRYQRQFCLLVPARADARHQIRSLMFCEKIHHQTANAWDQLAFKAVTSFSKFS